MSINPNRADYLTTQYVWTIQNESAWHSKCSPTVGPGDYATFRRITGNYISTIKARLSRTENEILTLQDWAYIRVELWKYLGGDIKHVEASDLNFLGCKADDRLYATYGEAYTTVRDGINAGLRWKKDDENLLKKWLISRRYDLKTMAESLGRGSLSVCLKAVDLGLLIKDSNSDFYYPDDFQARSETILSEVEQHITNAQGYFDAAQMKFHSITKEITMTVQTNPSTAFETKTIIFGREASTMTEQDLIDAIKRIEGDIAKLKEVKTESKKIKSNIAELEANLAKIVEVLDAR